MGFAAADCRALLLWSAAGGCFLWLGFRFADSYSSNLAADSQLFYLFGVALGVFGVCVFGWLALSVLFAVAARCFEAFGRHRIALQLDRLSPRFIRRLVGATVTCLLLASPSVAIDVGFQDTPEDDHSLNAPADPTPQEASDSVPDPAELSEIPAELGLEIDPTPVAEAPNRRSEQESTPTRLPTTKHPIPERVEGGSTSAVPVDLRLLPTTPDASDNQAQPQPAPTARRKHRAPSRSANPPAVQPVPVPGQQRRSSAKNSVVVMRGDSLWSIVRAELGPAASDAQIQLRLQHWYLRNRSVIGADPNLIYPGTTLIVPTGKDS